MARYNCKFCGYSTEKSFKPHGCDYCGKKDAMVLEESAEELINELT